MWKIGFLSPHPDDVELSCGVTMQRLVLSGHGVRYYCITNGAPTREAFRRIRRLPRSYDPAGYEACRKDESTRALTLIGIQPEDITFLGYPDLDTYRHIGQLTRDLSRILGTLDVVLCCPFEGGHPDHDVVRFCLAAAVMRVRYTGSIFEYASYNRRGWQVFLEPQPSDIDVSRFTNEEQDLKANITCAFESQKEDALRFSNTFERFRSVASPQQQLDVYLRSHEHPYYETFAYPQRVVHRAIAEYLGHPELMS